MAAIAMVVTILVFLSKSCSNLGGPNHPENCDRRCSTRYPTAYLTYDVGARGVTVQTLPGPQTVDGAIEIPGCLSDTQVGEKLIEFEEAVATSPSTLGKSFSDATQIRLSMCAFLASHLKQVQRAAFYSSIDKYLMYESFGSPFVYDALTKNVQSRRDAALLDLAVAEETLRAKPTDIHALSVHAAISAAIGDSQTTRRDIESLGVLAPELRERLSNALYHLGSR